MAGVFPKRLYSVYLADYTVSRSTLFVFKIRLLIAVFWPKMESI